MKIASARQTARRLPPGLTLCALILALATPGTASAQESASKPNILVILADNLGYGDLGCYGGLRAPTPRIDRLASQGLRLRDFQVEPACTQSRAAFLTGRMPIRSGTSSGTNKGGLNPREVTLPELLKRAGYRTALYGKWHLGEAPDRQPQAQGFDEFYGILGSSAPIDPSIPGYADVRPPLQEIVRGRSGAAAVPVGEMTYEMRSLIDRELTRQGSAFIKENSRRDAPFFLQVSYINVHHPVVPHADFAGKSGGGAYSDALMEMDYNTGVLLDALKEAGAERDTIVVWMSDNGATRRAPDGEQNADPGPWSGDLGSAWEGGLRTAAIVRWPGHVGAGGIGDEMVHIMDFYPTLARVAGQAVPDDRPIDGVDQLSYLTGEADRSARESRFVFYLDRLVAIRFRQFKLHQVIFPRVGGALSKGEDLEVPQLYNLRSDPKEMYDILSRSGGLPIAKAVKDTTKPYFESLRKYPNEDYTRMQRDR